MSNIKDKRIELSGRDKILRRLAKRLEPLGFTRSKTNLFRRSINDLIWGAITVSKDSGWPDFKVYITVQVQNDSLDFTDLAIFSSQYHQNHFGHTHKKYDFRYHIAEDTLDRCVRNLHEYVVEVAQPWFQQWEDVASPLISSDRPAAPDFVQGMMDDSRDFWTRALKKDASTG